MMRRPAFWTAEKLLGMTAFLISAGTFLLFVYQTHLIQKQQYASVLPYLESWNNNPSPDVYKLIVVNSGLGPAFIKSVKVHYQGKVYDTDPAGFIQKQMKFAVKLDFFYSNLTVGRSISPGKEIELLSVEKSQESADLLRKLFGDETAKLEIVYSSVYDETWRLKGMGTPPEKLK